MLSIKKGKKKKEKRKNERKKKTGQFLISRLYYLKVISNSFIKKTCFR